MRIGLLCSGGDAPGMNACMRAVVRAALAAGHEVVGINRGYHGLLNEDFFCNRQGLPCMTLRSVSGWARHGGAYLRSSRSEEFRSKQGIKKATQILLKHKIDALLPIGGDGTFRGAIALMEHWKGQVVGCPGTIDNDLIGTDFTIGFSTAVQTAVEAVDKIHDTAESHERMFLVEVMGRHSGYIAVYTALACGAEIACIPETPTVIEDIRQQVQILKDRGKTSIMAIVAEGDGNGGAEILNGQLKKSGCPFQTRVVVLGHLQRGGTPTPEDRLLGSMLGEGAVRALIDGENGVMVGSVGGRCRMTSFAEAVAGHKPIPKHLLALMDVLAR